jgi:hypothetical protein
MINIFMFFVMLCLIVSQFMAGNLGLYLPLVPLGIFYFSINGGWLRGTAAAIIAGLIIDMLYSRPYLLSSWLYILVVIFAAYWLIYQSTRQLSASILPGLAIPAIVLVPQWLLIVAGINDVSMFILKTSLPMTVFCLLFSAAFLPVLILILDKMCRKCGLPLYVNAKQRYEAAKRD